MAMAGRKRKCPAAPEKITHYFLPVKDSDDGNVEMECEDPASPLGQSRTVMAMMAQTQPQLVKVRLRVIESSGGNIMDLGCIIKPMTTLKEV